MMLRRRLATSLPFTAALLSSAWATHRVRFGLDEALAGTALSRPTTQPDGCSVKYP